MKGMEFYLSIAFMVVFIKLLVDQAPAIAEFLCGGQPRLSFGEFAQAAASGAAAGMAAAGAGGSLVKGAAATGAAFAGMGDAAFSSARTASDAGKIMGGRAGQNFMAGVKSFGKSIGQSAVQGGANVIDKGINTLTNAPQSAKKLGQLMRYGIHPASPLSQEGIGFAPERPRNRNEAHPGGGEVWKDGKRSEPTNGEHLMQSKNISERVKGMGELYREKRVQGAGYSGMDGRFKALKSSVEEFREANRKAAPGTTGDGT